MASQIDLCNRALSAIAARSTISSFTDGSQEAEACAVWFTPTYEMLARAAQWNIFRKQASLSLLKAASGTPENTTGTAQPIPPTPWLYSYAYPSDCLYERYLIPASTSSNSSSSSGLSGMGWANSTIGQSQSIPFAVAYDTDTSGNPIRVILTNLDTAQAVYTVNQPNPIGWDSQFQQAFVSSLAAWLVPALTGNMQMMQIQIELAERIVGQARVTDGDEGLTIMDHVPDWISVRGYSWSNGSNSNTAGYSNMIWPS